MPKFRDTLRDQGFDLNRRDLSNPNRNEPTNPDIKDEIPLSKIPQKIPNDSLDLSKLNLSRLNPNEDMGTSNFSSGSLGWRIYGNGNAEFNSVTIRGTIYATAGRIANWYINADTLSSGPTEASSNVLIDSANSLIRLGPTSGSYVTIDGANQRIRSSNYVTGVSGFSISPTLLEAENIIARGILKGTTFQYDVVSAVGGQLLVTNADSLASDMTALDASTMTTKGTTTFAVNDIIHIRAITASGIQEEYLRITNIGSAPTYTVTRDLAAAYGANSNPIWQAGTTIVKEGLSDGGATYSGGWLRLLGNGTNSPYYSVFSRTGVAYNAYSERVRLGNLNGIGSFVADTYGIFIGNYSANQYLSYDDVSGNLLVNGSNLSNQPNFGDGSDGDVTISSNTSLSSDMFYNNLTVNAGFTLNPNGYRIFVKGTLTVNSTGIVARDGQNGGNGGAGTNAVSGVGSTANNGGTAGTAGAVLSSGSLPGSAVGLAGLVGRNGNSQKGGAYTFNGLAGNAGNAGSAATKSMIGSGAAGGASGNGGSCTGAAGASGAAGGAAGASTGTILNKIRTYVSAYLLYDQQSGTWFTTSGGSGSGAGGASGGAHHGNDPTFDSGSGGGGGGGGSASSGGVVAIFARFIVNNGTIRAIGGNGGNGGNAGTSQAAVNASAGGSGGGGGGGGGNGGVLILVYANYSGSGTTSVAAGTGGTAGLKASGAAVSESANNGTDGVAGTDGSVGLSITLQQ